MKAGIIGGTGKMGKLFAGVFERAGHEVFIAGRSTSLTAHRLAEQCDLVMVSVPIRDTVGVIESIAPVLHRDQVLCDLTSLKVLPVAAMLESEAQVVGFHPMFGPSVQSLRNQTIITCPARVDAEKLDSLLAIFRNEGAECTLSTPEVHDRMMAVVQGLTHFVTLTVAETIRRMKLDVGKTGPFMSPVYQIELSLVGRLLSQDPGLYADILQQNPFVPAVLEACTASAHELKEIVGTQDPEQFSEFFRKDSRHFGRFAESGQELTDLLIESMVNR